MAEHRPIIRQDSGTGAYFWKCWCGVTWQEDPESPEGDPVLDAEATALEHLRRMEQVAIDSGYFD
jgi:hypothetical protein